MSKNCITDIEGIKVGQITDKHNMTGCTVILIPDGAICGVNICGGAPGSRESGLLLSEKDNSAIHSIFLSGGSAYCLAVGDGIMRYLEENNIGFDTGDVKVPIVPGAVLYDLNVGNPYVRPDANMGYLACVNASDEKIHEGNYGAGTGASVGKVLGNENIMKGGIGSSSFVSEDGLVVGAIVAVNAFGSVVDYNTGKILAGPILNGEIVNTEKYMIKHLNREYHFDMNNTTLAVVGTNASLTKSQCNFLAQNATHGLIRAINPVCTTLDGDTVFAFSKGEVECDINILASLASRVLSEAVINAIKAADSVNNIPSFKSLNSSDR